MRPRSKGRHARGQALVEFAIVVPILMILIGGIIQFGIIFWAQNTLTQIARDTGRWAATQQACTGAEASLISTKAGQIAAQSSLIGYPTGFTAIATWSDKDGNPPLPGKCPPSDNTQVFWVNITVTATVPIFFPLVPGNGNLSTSTQFRMEPADTNP